MMSYKMPVDMSTVKVGMIFVDTWGYDQTNANFFQVVKVNAKTVSVREIKAREVEDVGGFMTGVKTPIKGAFIGEPTTRSLYMYSGSMFINSQYGSAELWDGKGVAVSHYA
jgi:hypothetical protein